MTALARPRFWTGPRVFALAATGLVTVLFLGANAHLITVAFTSRPDCVLQPLIEGAASYRAAKPSC